MENRLVSAVVGMYSDTSWSYGNFNGPYETEEVDVGWRFKSVESGGNGATWITVDKANQNILGVFSSGPKVATMKDCGYRLTPGQRFANGKVIESTSAQLPPSTNLSAVMSCYVDRTNLPRSEVKVRLTPEALVLQTISGPSGTEVYAMNLASDLPMTEPSEFGPVTRTHYRHRDGVTWSVRMSDDAIEEVRVSTQYPGQFTERICRPVDPAPGDPSAAR